MKYFILIQLIFLLNFNNNYIFGKKILLTGIEGTGSYSFGKELVRLVLNKNIEELVLRPVEISSDRLEKLRNRQGHFAIVDAETAFLKLKKNPYLPVISILWPNWLHIIKNNNFSSLNKFLVHPSAKNLVKKLIIFNKNYDLTLYNNDTPLEFNEYAFIIKSPIPIYEINKMFYIAL